MFNKNENKKRFVKKSDDSLGLVTIYTVEDVDTGVNYLITLSPSGTAITPLLDKNGGVIINREK